MKDKKTVHYRCLHDWFFLCSSFARIRLRGFSLAWQLCTGGWKAKERRQLTAYGKHCTMHLITWRCASMCPLLSWNNVLLVAIVLSQSIIKANTVYQVSVIASCETCKGGSVQFPVFQWVCHLSGQCGLNFPLLCRTLNLHQPLAGQVF